MIVNCVTEQILERFEASRDVLARASVMLMGSGSSFSAECF